MCATHEPSWVTARTLRPAAGRARANAGLEPAPMPWALVNALQGWGIEVVACAKGVCVRLWASSVHPFSGPGRLPATPGGALAVWRRSALVWPEAGFGVSGGLMRGALVRPKVVARSWCMRGPRSQRFPCLAGILWLRYGSHALISALGRGGGRQSVGICLPKGWQSACSHFTRMACRHAG